MDYFCINNNVKAVALLLGVPGVGKSSFLKHFSKERSFVICGDIIRELLGTYWDFNSEAHSAFKDSVYEHLVSLAPDGAEIIFDDTGIDHDIPKLKEVCKDKGIELLIFYFEPKEGVVEWSQNKRLREASTTHGSRYIPPDAMEQITKAVKKQVEVAMRESLGIIDYFYDSPFATVAAYILHC